jgi:hypothetical protein
VGESEILAHQDDSSDSLDEGLYAREISVLRQLKFVNELSSHHSAAKIWANSEGNVEWWTNRCMFGAHVLQLQAVLHPPRIRGR